MGLVGGALKAGSYSPTTYHVITLPDHIHLSNEFT
jgi:hypothetical protein